MSERIEGEQLVSYLKSLAAISMLVVSMSGPVFDIGTTIKSTYELAQAVQAHPDFFGGGPYWIESTPNSDWKDQPIPNPTVAKYAYVFSVHATLARSGKEFGGHTELLKALGAFEVIHRSNPKENGGVGHLLVKLPNSPVELDDLRQKLMANAVCFSIDDGSGYFHETNTFMGNGLRA